MIVIENEIISRILDDETIANVVFYPRKSRKPEKSNNKIPFELNIKENINIGGIFHLKSKNLPSLLMFHGNGEIAEEYDYFIENYLNTGVNCAIIDFRGYGFSSGYPTLRFLVEDSYPIFIRFLSWLYEQNFQQSIILFGRSLGSVCISEIGFHNPDHVLGYIYESGFADTFELLRKLFRVKLPEIDEKIIAPWTNKSKIPLINKPTLVMHGTHDMIVPLAQGELIYKLLPDNIFKKFIGVKNAGHNNIIMHEDRYFPPLKEFIQSLIKQNPSLD